MNSFYGNLKNNSRASFIFDKVYPTRKLMDESAASDGVFVNRYVLIAYDYQEVQLDDGGRYQVNANSRYGNFLTEHQNMTNAENPQFVNNRNDDISTYGAQFDKTVWMKIYSNNKEKYIQVGALNATAPAFELVVDAPSEEQPHFDYYHSGDLTYSYHMPRIWEIDLNRFNSQIEKDDSFFEKVETLPAADSDEWKNNKYYFKNPINGYYYLELDGQREGIEYYKHSEKYNYQYDDLLNDNNIVTQLSEYPYVNNRGFQSNIRNYDYINLDNISFTEVASGQEYPDHVFLPILLTIDTYTKNTYYTLEDGEYVFQGADQEFDSNKNYYIKTQGEFEEVSFGNGVTYAANKFFYLNDKNEYIADSAPSATENRTYYKFKISHATSVQDDTKRLDIELPSIGNAISDVYDSIYGRPLYPNYPNGIKYTSDPPSYKSNDTTFQTYYDEEHTYQCSIDGKYYYLTVQEWNNELFNDYDENAHPIPVYNLANDKRPYTQQQLYNFLNIEPYNNVTPMDPVSMAWGVEELKKYISELRYLSHGELNGDFDPIIYNGNGLQSDWAVDDPTSFGYIYNKPLVISHYKQVMDHSIINPEDILYMRDVDDDKHVPYFFEGHINAVGNGTYFNYQTAEYILLSQGEVTENTYQPNTYYYKNVYGNYVLDTLEHFTPDRNYYNKIPIQNNESIPITFKDENAVPMETYDNIKTPFVYQVADPITKYVFDEALNDYSNFTTNGDNHTASSNMISLIETTEDNIQIYRSGQVGNNLFNYSYTPIPTDTLLYEPNKYYYYSNNSYNLDSNTNPQEGRQYYRQERKGRINQSNNGIVTKYPYLGLGGKLIYELQIKGIDEDLSQKELFEFINQLNSPGFYDEHIVKIVYATNRLVNTTIPPNFMDLTAIRDGKFHIYTNIRSSASGLAIEKIWQNIPVDDIMVAEMYYDIEDISDVIGDGIVQNTESINVLESPFLSLNDNVNKLQKRTNALEQTIGLNSDDDDDENTSLIEQVNILNDYIRPDSTTKSLSLRVLNLELDVGTVPGEDTINLIGQVSEQQSEITDIKNYIGASDKETNAAYNNTLGYRINALETYSTNLNNRIDTSSTTINSLNTRITDVENDIGDINTAGTIKQSIQTNRNSINEISSRLGTVETFVGNASSTTNTLSSRLTDAENNIVINANNITTNTNNITTNTNNITLLQNYTGINDSEQSTTATLNARITSIEEEISQEP